MTFNVETARPSGLVPAPLAATDLRAPEIRIGPESVADAPAREALLDEAFGPARRTRTSERLREGRRPATGLALAARDRSRLVGTLRCWAVEAGGRPRPAARTARRRPLPSLARHRLAADARGAVARRDARPQGGSAGRRRALLRALRLRRRADEDARSAGPGRSRALSRLRDRARRAGRRGGHGRGGRRARRGSTTRAAQW